MKTSVVKILFLCVLIAITAAACSSGGRLNGNKNCGCNLNKGFVGY
jgi:hypothetical protein